MWPKASSRRYAVFWPSASATFFGQKQLFDPGPIETRFSASHKTLTFHIWSVQRGSAIGMLQDDTVAVCYRCHRPNCSQITVRPLCMSARLAKEFRSTLLIEVLQHMFASSVFFTPLVTLYTSTMQTSVTYTFIKAARPKDARDRSWLTASYLLKAI